MQSVTQKKCTKCGETKDNDFTNFPKTIDNTTGSWCRKCIAKKVKNYREIKYLYSNPQRIIRRFQKILKWPTFPKIKLTEEEREQIRYEKRRDYTQKNKEIIKRKVQKYNKEHTDLLAIRRNSRRAKKYNVENTLTFEEWIEIKNKYDNRCLCCGNQSPIIISDHILPLSQGGSNTKDNIQPLCKICNNRKARKYIDYRPI